MPEEDAKIWGDVYALYEKWRSVLITDLSQWLQITNDFHEIVVRYNGNPLALRLANGAMEAFDDMYRNGKQPVMPDYIGRGDL